MRKNISTILCTVTVIMMLTLSACGKNTDSNTNGKTDSTGSSLSFKIDCEIPEISFTGNKVSEPEYEALPNLTKEGERYYITVDGYEPVKFEVPMSLKERFERMGSDEETNVLFLEEVPKFNFTFPEELTDEILSDYSECEPKISSVNAEKAYVNSDGTVYISLSKSMLGNRQYIYELTNVEGDDIAWIYYDADTRKVFSVAEFSYDYENLMVRDFKCTRHFYYTDGVLTRIAIEAEATDYSDNAKGSDTYYFETNKAEMTYHVVDGKINELSDCLFYSSYHVWDLTDTSNMEMIDEGSYSYYDKSGNLIGIRVSKYATEDDKEKATSTTYYYLMNKNAWYTEEGNLVGADN